MALSHEHIESKISEKIKIYILSRAKLLCSLCHEIPCMLIPNGRPCIQNTYFACDHGINEFCSLLSYFCLAGFAIIPKWKLKSFLARNSPFLARQTIQASSCLVRKEYMCNKLVQKSTNLYF